MLQRAICDLFCSSDKDIIYSSRQWLHIDNEPTVLQICHPKPDSFIGICRALRVDWHWLMETLRAAAEPELEIVQTNELLYNRQYEPINANEAAINGDRTSQAARRKH